MGFKNIGSNEELMNLDSFPGPINTQRRRFLQLAAMGSMAAMTVNLPARAHTDAGRETQIDTTGASPDLAAFMTDFFEAKTNRDIDATMSFFSPDLVTYIDATLGWDIAGYEALKGVFTQYMPNWPDTARSYATRIVGDMQGGAFVAFTDTPELFGGELRLLAVIDFKDGKIIRWIDHWDSRDWPNDYGLEKAQLTDFRQTEVASATPAKMADVSQKLLAVFENDPKAEASDVFAYDVVFEDMALRSQLIGRNAVQAHLKRALPMLPYGKGVVFRHVVGSDDGGAIEWTATATAPVNTGVTGVVLDSDGRIARLTTVYDGGRYADTHIGRLSAAVLNI